jgi:hypothetical protein
VQLQAQKEQVMSLMAKQQEGGGLKGGGGVDSNEDFGGGGSKGFEGDWGQVDNLRRQLQIATDERYVSLMIMMMMMMMMMTMTTILLLLLLMMMMMTTTTMLLLMMMMTTMLLLSMMTMVMIYAELRPFNIETVNLLEPRVFLMLFYPGSPTTDTAVLLLSVHRQAAMTTARKLERELANKGDEVDALNSIIMRLEKNRDL